MDAVDAVEAGQNQHGGTYLPGGRSPGAGTQQRPGQTDAEQSGTDLDGTRQAYQPSDDQIVVPSRGSAADMDRAHGQAGDEGVQMPARDQHADQQGVGAPQQGGADRVIGGADEQAAGAQEDG